MPAGEQSRIQIMGSIAAIVSACLAVYLFAFRESGPSAAPAVPSTPSATADPAPGNTSPPAAAKDDPTARYLRPDADIPHQYRAAIVEAGTAYCEAPAVTPALVAAMVKAESGFDPDLSDPAKDEYGIARWTPRVLQHYWSGDRSGRLPAPPYEPNESIRAVGRFLCHWQPSVAALPGDPALNLAAVYRTSDTAVRSANGIPDRIRAYTDRVNTYLAAYRPVSGS
ncbi:hypothetical protein ACFQLX_01425 [Streptomyces polyrhachis]|uniref:Transglycosylase SLT domain-containing protein n=1 Tax=Streptomyces polyrhachis TaxID=1282885 RepID=A0ABW2G7X3_9ACTN